MLSVTFLSESLRWGPQNSVAEDTPIPWIFYLIKTVRGKLMWGMGRNPIKEVIEKGYQWLRGNLQRGILCLQVGVKPL